MNNPNSSAASSSNAASSSKAASSSNAASSGPSHRRMSKPNNSRFWQQNLRSCRPILTPKLVVAMWTLLGVIFIPIGIVSLHASRSVVEIEERYDINCIPEQYRKGKNDRVEFIQSPENKTCTRLLIVPKHMKKPVYVYYELNNFLQNHRRYVKSRSDVQLKNPCKENDTKACKPMHQTADNLAIVPCGLIAWSLFNDTYRFSWNNTLLQVNKTSIAWKSDRDSKFGKNVHPKNFQNVSLIGGGKLDPTKPLSDQEDLMVWMRTSALPTFRKMYGRIEDDLNENDVLNVTIENNYNTYTFDGKKTLVLSTTSWLGGKNDILGLAYITVGGICLILAIGFTVIIIVKPRPLGDPAYLSWNKKSH